MVSRRGSVGARRSSRKLRQSRFRRYLAVVAIGVLSVALVTPARAQFDFANPAAWATVIQMTQAVGHMVAIKRQVENVRNLAATQAMGAFAPLVDGLGPVTESIRETQAVLSGDIPFHVPDTFPVDEDDPGLEPIPATPFNAVLQVCPEGEVPGDEDIDEGDLLSDEDVDFVDLCMPSIEVSYSSDLSDRYEVVLTDAEISPVPTYMADDSAYLELRRDARERLAAQFEARIEAQAAAAEREAEEVALMQADVETMMALAEEFYGCISVPADGVLDPNADQRYCATNNGGGRGETVGGTTGTSGLLDDLLTQLDTVARQPEGNASMSQLATLQTRASLYQARATAAVLQARAAVLEREAQDRLADEAAERRRYELYNAHLQCQAEHNTVYARFVPDMDTLAFDAANPQQALQGECVWTPEPDPLDPSDLEDTP